MFCVGSKALLNALLILENTFQNFCVSELVYVEVCTFKPQEVKSSVEDS